MDRLLFRCRGKGLATPARCGSDKVMKARLAYLLAPAALALVTGCDPRPGVSPVAFDSTPRCGAEKLQGLLGQNASVLGGMEFDAPLRVIRPGMAVTMDYSPDRLNIELDEDDTIIRLWCA